MPDWFEPKRYGYGAGLPIAWHGWALLVAYIGLMTGSSLLAIRFSLIAMAIFIAALTAAFLLMVKRTTRGGWRWSPAGTNPPTGRAAG